MADQKLEKLKQTGSVHAYLTCFVELSSHLKMTKQTKINWFMKGLKPVIKDNLISIIDQPLTSWVGRISSSKLTPICTNATLNEKKNQREKIRTINPLCQLLNCLLFQLLHTLLYPPLQILFLWMQM